MASTTLLFWFVFTLLLQFSPCILLSKLYIQIILVTHKGSNGKNCLLYHNLVKFFHLENAWKNPSTNVPSHSIYAQRNKKKCDSQLKFLNFRVHAADIWISFLKIVSETGNILGLSLSLLRAVNPISYVFALHIAYSETNSSPKPFVLRNPVSIDKNSYQIYYVPVCLDIIIQFFTFYFLHTVTEDPFPKLLSRKKDELPVFSST
jgi:hypothetical protein